MAPQDFSFGKAVFHFFSIAGKRPTAALWIALWQAVLTGALVYLAFVTIGDFYLWLIGQIASGVEPNETELLSRIGGVIAFGPLISIGGMLISLMAQAAWLRLLTREEVAPVIPFRIGGDELRLFVTNVGLMAIGMLFYFATSLIVGIVVGVGIAAAVAGDGSVGAGMAGGLFVGLFIIALVLAAIFVAVRLSAAPATTVLEKRIAFPAWGATRGVFWPVLGSYIVVAIIIFILSSIIGTIVNFAFRQFVMRKAAEAGEVIAEAPVWLGDADTVGLVPAEDISLLMPVTSREGIRGEVTWTGPLEAPIAAGTELARFTISRPGLNDTTVPLMAASDVGKAGFLPRFTAAAGQVFERARMLAGGTDADDGADAPAVN